MLFKTSFTALVVATLAVLTAAPQQAEAHSWVDCADWRPASSNNFGKGKCNGYARRFPVKSKIPFGKLDSAYPNRHYQQNRKNPNSALSCSNRRDGTEPGSDETRPKGNKWSDAYGGSKWGSMTVKKAGDRVCFRWPAKNHSREKNAVHVYLWKQPNITKDPTQQQLMSSKAHDIQLSYGKYCAGGNSDTKPCGGCFNLPKNLKKGVYFLQWRWMLNRNEFYTSCVDVQVK